MVFQHFNLYPNKTVLENITLAPTKVLNKSEKDAGDTAESLLDRVGMLDKKKILTLQRFLVDNNNVLLLQEG